LPTFAAKNTAMRNSIALVFTLLLCCPLLAQNRIEKCASRYLESIRDKEAELTAFFLDMPKGGDLHHHFAGSIYAESFATLAVMRQMWLQTSTLKLANKPGAESDWAKISDLQKSGTWPEYRDRLLRLWSAKDFQATENQPSYAQFFNSFGHFGQVEDDLDGGLLELKNRAKAEKVAYLETMMKRVNCGPLPEKYKTYTALLQNLARNNESAALDTLRSLYRQLRTPELENCVRDFNANLHERHQRLAIDDEEFTLRYQTYVLRINDPLFLYRQLIASFLAEELSPLVVGVNIVAPEHDEVSMSNYQLHMLMFRVCTEFHPTVKKSLHAGELILGLVKPEDLHWHINSAVQTAGAHRIGHGVDLAHELNSDVLLRQMAQKGIAVEINLSSNAFILGIKGSAHPISMYHRAGVPLVISTDDAGVLRSNHTAQFVHLAQQYPQFAYAEIKRMVFNSIRYSFLDEVKKQSLLQKLAVDFQVFEAKWGENTRQLKPNGAMKNKK
jgi:adenosine deaminase